MVEVRTDTVCAGCQFGKAHQLPYQSSKRGAYYVMDNEDSTCFLVSGQSVYLLFNETELYRMLVTLEESTAPVRFFLYDESFYLLDGKHIYTLGSNGFEKAIGYVPLYGLGWDPITMGEILEPINYLNTKLRVNYLNPDGLTSFYLPFYASSIDSVIVDGKKTPNYTFGTDTRTVIVRDTGREVEIAFTFQMESRQCSALQESTLAFSDEMDNHHRLLLGGAIYSPYLFVNTPVSTAQLNGTKLHYPTATALYFTADGIITVGNTLAPLTAFYRNNRHILGFTQTSIFALEPTSSPERMEPFPIKTNLGCVTPGMDVVIDGDPLILNEAGLFRVHLDSQYDLRCTHIPCPYPELTQEGFAQNAIVCENARHNEIWFRDRRDNEGTVLVYNTVREDWLLFKGIYADHFFDRIGTPGICSGKLLGFFKEGRYSDNETEIEATLSTEMLDFDYPELFKRTLRFSMVARSPNQQVMTTLETDHRTRSLTFVGKPSTAVDFFDARAAMGRFRYLAVTVRHSTPSPFCIKRISLYANL